MPKFIYVYHGGKKPDKPEEAEKIMMQWKAWLDGLGDAAFDKGNPVGMSKTVFADRVEENGGSNPTSGYSIIIASNAGDAVAKSKGCPHLANGGTIEIAEIVDLNF